MSSEKDYLNFIKTLTTHSQLLKKWDEYHKDKKLDGWGKGKFLEYSILRAFELEQKKQKEKLGFDVGHVSYPYEVSYPIFGEKHSHKILEQIDGAICVKGLYALAEFKDYNSQSISVEPLAKMRNMLARRSGNMFGIFFSATPFTIPAQIQVQFMSPQLIILWGIEDMNYCMKNECFIECMEWKYRQAIELCEYNLNYEQEKSQYPICQPLF